MSPSEMTDPQFQPRTAPPVGIYVDKPINIEQLALELQPVGVVGLAQTGHYVHTHAPDGKPIDLPPAAVPIVEAHNANTLTPEQADRKNDWGHMETYYKATDAEWLALTAGQRDNFTRDAVKTLMRHLYRARLEGEEA